VWQCIAAGVDGIEHCSCVVEQGTHTPLELTAAIAAAAIPVCPTLGHDLSRLAGSLSPQMAAAIKRNGGTVEDRLVQVGELHRGGVTLISGVDSGIHPVKAHGILPLAIIELAAAGVSPTTALASATSVAARASGLADRTGRLRAGLDADLLLVDGDPTDDITAIRHTRAVVSRGRMVHLYPGTEPATRAQLRRPGSGPSGGEPVR
jgi:imidazolonepropionase-like amidohydrolase